MPDNQNDIFLHIGRLEGKVDGINQRLDTSNGRIAKGEGKHDGLEKRVGKLENKVGITFGVFTAIWALIQFAAPYISHLIQ